MVLGAIYWNPLEYADNGTKLKNSNCDGIIREMVILYALQRTFTCEINSDF